MKKIKKLYLKLYFRSEHNPNLCLPLTFLQRQYHYMTSETMKTRQRKIKKNHDPLLMSIQTEKEQVNPGLLCLSCPL